MKKLTFIFFCATMLLMASCTGNDVVFTYKPATPAAGETIKFSNTTEKGEEWSWNFGDGTTSTSKSPSKVYKKPGTYTVVLKVDDKASRTCTQTITVRDTVPAIGVSDSIVYYYKAITLTADAYNPYSHEVSVTWELPAAVKILSGELTDKQIEVCFTAIGAVELKCQLTQGDKSYALDTVLTVEDTPSRSLILARGKEVMRQRIYDYGYEEPTSYPIDQKAVTAPAALVCNGDMLYIFNADKTANGVLGVFNLAEGGTELLVQNAAAGNEQGFEQGYQSKGIVYWTAADKVYKTDESSRNIRFTAGSASQQLLASATDLGLAAGQTSGGIIEYNGVCLYAYAQGVMRFDRNQPAHQKGQILTDYTITAMALDRVSQKLYFTAEGGLYVANITGEYPVLLDASADGKSLSVAADDNRLFFTTAAGVKEIALVHSPNNSTSAKAALVNDFNDVTALAVDAQLR